MKFVTNFKINAKQLGDVERIKWRARMEANKKGVALDQDLEYFTLFTGADEVKVQVYIPSKQGSS